MTPSPAELLDRLDYTEAGGFPKKAIQEIIARKEEMVPHLLGVLESAYADPQSYLEGRKSMLCTYAAYLLAQFRETRAYRPLIALLSLGDGIPDGFFGDSITEDMHNILAGVFDGDEEPLRRMIENPSACEYVRSSAGLYAYLALIKTGVLPIESVESYFRELFEGKLKREHSHVWNNLCSISGDLGFASLIAHIDQAFEEGLCDWLFDSYEDIIKRAMSGGNDYWQRNCVPVDDVVSIMQRWACFNQKTMNKPPKKAAELLSRIEWRDHSSRTLAQPPRYPGVTRNDPCPCGSGRKFKKCCGG